MSTQAPALQNNSDLHLWFFSKWLGWLINKGLSWFNPCQQLNIMQLVTHSSLLPVGWGEELGKKTLKFES